MQEELDSPAHDRRRSDFIRELVQRPLRQRRMNNHFKKPTPKTIVQFWHDLGRLPHDVKECIHSWTVWETSGFEHNLFDERAASAFISSSLSTRHERAFERCYHPAMKADYFRLCYLLTEGGFYVDADDVCIGTDIGRLVEDGRLKLQPLCYDTSNGRMVNPTVFLRADAYDPSWIFYFNNNPLIASPGHPVIERALFQATSFLEVAGENDLPEIQMATGPGNISKSIFDLGTRTGDDIESMVVTLKDWDSLAISKWPLSYRDDARNWRLSNQKRFDSH